MKRLYLIIFLAVFTACGSVSNPERAINNLEPRPGVSSTQIDSISQTLRYFPNQTQFSIAFIADNSFTFYGAVRTNDTLKTIDNKDSVFEIGSLSKVFTAALLADLATENKLQLDQPIQAHLDFPLHDSLQITFKELANHTSGLPRIPSGFVWESLWHMDNPYKDYDEKKLREYLSHEMELANKSETPWQYSNIGAGILGYTLTQIEGQSYEQMLQQRIFAPLGMQHSTTQRKLVKESLVTGLNKRGNPTSYWDLGAIPGAGAIVSTAEDLAKFGQANFDPNNEALKLQQQKTFTVNKDRDMALGWFILKQDSTTLWNWHNGGTGGYRSSIVLDVDEKKGVIVLSNISAGHSHAAKIDSLSFSLLKSKENQTPSPEMQLF
ncbi:serine hydrolase domain-containing protein [Fodinibius sp. SL11]|uniref:serine hydrolase domain-containing protein n=1 Tax=Fodinibius sp. SL11 TaxID=3425690 RepID=UPI003F880C4B